MPSPTATADFLTSLRRSGLLDDATLSKLAANGTLTDDPLGSATALVRKGFLTDFQAKQLLKGRFRGFILGPYKLLRPLGQGGMGVVYLGEHSLMRRQVAIKVLPHDKAQDRLALERFYREARAAAALDHPNIMRLYDVAQGGGVHFLVMEFVEGTTLDGLLATTGPLHHAQAIEYVAQAAAGLGHAHETGFVHRDIKPGNLMVTRQGQVKILDMGLARSLVDPNDQLTMAGANEATGTADFIAPEQAMNGDIDSRADIYSLGATLFTLLTGKAPFEGSTAQKLLQHQTKDPPPMHKLRAGVPPALGEIVGKMMAKQPEDRYQTAEEVIDALRPWLPAAETPANVVGHRFSDGDIELPRRESASGKKSTGPKPRKKEKKREPWLQRNKWVAAGVGAVLLIGVVWAAFGGSKPKATDTATGTPAPQPAATNTPQPPPADGERPIFTLNLSQVTPFRFTHQGGQASDPDWRNRVPSGIYLHCWKQSSSAEFRATADGGKVALGVTNLNDDLSSQIVFQFDDGLNAPTRPGQQYRLRFEYRTLNEAEGALHVRNPHNNDYPNVASAQLISTGGQWRTGDVSFRRPAEGRMDAIVDNKSVGEGNTIEVRGLELLEAGPSR